MFSAQLRYSSESGLTTAFQQANGQSIKLRATFIPLVIRGRVSFAPSPPAHTTDPRLMRSLRGRRISQYALHGERSAAQSPRHDLILETDTGDGMVCNGYAIPAGTTLMRGMAQKRFC